MGGRWKSSVMVLMQSENTSSLFSSVIICGLLLGVEIEGAWDNFSRSLALLRLTSAGGLLSSSDASSSLGINVGVVDCEGGSRGQGED